MMLNGHDPHSDDKPVPTIEARLRTLQVIVAALCTGVIIFGAIVAFAPVASSVTLNVAAQSAILIVVIAITFGGMAVRSALRRSIVRSVQVEVDEDRLFARFQAWTITTAAMFEAAALLGVVVFLLTRDSTALVLAGAVVLLMVGAAFPSRSRWEAFLADALYRRP
jgi:hypothetical protein